jgi:hypothetical protein
LNKQLTDYFTSSEKNIIKIEEIAVKIKNETIEPSFELLQRTLDEINGVKSEIELLKMQ